MMSVLGEIEKLVKVPFALQRENGAKKCERELVTKWLHSILKLSGWDPQDIESKYRIKEELTGTDGRLDLALKIEKRIVSCIEVKDPSIDIQPVHLLQAVRYAASYYYPVNGVLDPILAVCTNGKVAYLMDPAVADPIVPSHHIKIDLTNAEGLSKLINYLKISNLDQADGSILGVDTKRKTDVREFASNTHEKFKDFIFDITESILEKNFGKKSAVEMTVLVLLLAAARDNGVIPNSVITKCISKNDWQTLANHLGKVFGDVFIVNSKMQKYIWLAYEETTVLNLRLDIVPVHFMGIVYQELLSRFCNNKTSFYTPEDMINRVLDNLNPIIDDTILDPTCGSGAFLVSAIERGLANSGSFQEKELLNFFNNVVGVDKDAMAVKIAKVSVLCQFMRLVGEDYQKTGKSLPRPKIEKPIDFFDWKSGKFSLILGNPPWESIDKLNKKRKKQLSGGTYSSYEDKNDQLCYIVEKSVKEHLTANGRFGFIIKQQSLLGNKYKKFCQFLDNKVFRVFDYGNQMQFGNYAQSAIILGRQHAQSWEYIYLDPLPLADVAEGKERFSFRSNFIATRGAQTGGANKTYIAFGQKHQKNSNTRLYPKTLQLAGPPKSETPMFYFMGKPPAQFLKWLVKNPAQRKALEARGDVIASKSKLNPKGRLPYSWRRNSVAVKLGNNILITERNLTPGKSRFPVYITTQEHSLPLDGQTVIGSIDNSREDLVVLGGLLISRYFVPLARSCKLIPRRAGGIFMNPKTIHERLILPRLSDQDRFSLIEVFQNLTSRPANVEELNLIDRIFENYFSMGVQQNDSSEYGMVLLSDFLHPKYQDEEDIEKDLDSVG